MDFVMDRNQTHFKRLKDLKAKGWANLTASEKAEWNGEAAKGAYNCSDLNRVEAAVAELAPMFGLRLSTKTDWGVWDIPTASQMSRYLSNVAAIRGVALTVDGTSPMPELPDSMNFLTWDMANNIEKVLYIASALGGDTLTWDGDTEGKIMYDVHVKVAEVLPTWKDFESGCTVKTDGGAASITYSQHQLTVDQVGIYNPGADFIVVYNTTGTEWPETGIYFDASVGMRELTIPGYTKFVHIPNGSGVSATHDSEGNVVLSGVTATHDNTGNVVLFGAAATKDGDGNVTIS